jgi:4-amino-4-deoxy-L-arabinose transferase-like glycosyltransferase
VSASSPWRDPGSTQVAIALAIALAIANGVWLLLNSSVPSWDEAHYLSVALDYQRSLEGGGLIELLRAVKDADPAHGPLFTVALTPFIWIFGASNRSGLILNLCFAPFLFFCAGQIAWAMFRNWQARLLAMLLVGGTPLMVGLGHHVLQDFLLVTFATAAVLFLWNSEGFQRRGMTIGMAAAMGAGTLTKVTFPLFLVGPLAVVVLRVLVGLFSDRDELGGLRVDRRKLAINLGIAVVVFLVIAFAWYGPNFSATLDYIRSTTSGPLAEGAGPEHPLTFHAITTFTLGVINYNLTWIVMLLGLVAVALDWERILGLFSRPRRAEPLWKLAFLLAWAVIPYLSVALAHNQDVRLMAPAFPAVCVLAAGAVSYIRWPRVRYALAGAAVVLLAYVTVNHDTDITPSGLPERAQVRIGEYAAAQQLDSQPIGYEELPSDDYTTPMLEFIEKVAAQQPGGLAVPRTICDLQEEGTTNYNTLNFLSQARGDPFTVVPVAIGAGGEKELEENIAGTCTFAVYTPPPELSPAEAEERVALVNVPSAANHMTPQIFGLFRGPRQTFPLTAAAAAKAGAGSLKPEASTTATVLTRTPGS